MLVLTRKSGEGVRIGDGIHVVIVEIKDNQVRLGIEAPRDVSIHRDEVYLKIQDENIRAAKLGKDVFVNILKRWKGKE